MAKREEMRNLETIPVGSLGIIALKGCQELGEKVDQYLVDWRTERENEHKDSLAFKGYQRSSYLLQAKVPRFGSGEAKGVISGICPRQRSLSACRCCQLQSDLLSLRT